ncbi:MAG: endolytic transglycosylase MltG [Actinobacteria bacterium]|uniref:Unannotated protein n=1 Tax=freshwater metagenome TaxID=449393 RepID=A0A6J7G6I8_9ZZZZ|nr:endolytic transglycosylase MltG [Actinomycetota bacterium]
MTNETHGGDSIAQHTPQSSVGGRRQRRGKRRGLLISLISAGVVVVLLGTGAVLYVSGALDSIIHPGPADYEGAGTGSVSFTITPGENGEQIAQSLFDEGVTASFEAFYNLLLTLDPQPIFVPGVFTLKEHMSAQAALDALLNHDNLQVDTVAIPEGTSEAGVIATIAEATGLKEADIQAAANDVASFGVPAESPKLEGFLFPATYTFTPGTSAHDILQAMVDRCMQSLDDAGVAPADRFKIITMASLIQKEAGIAPDFPKVSRVFWNRLDENYWPTGLLESDATVAYGAGIKRVETTVAERANADNPYNTYVHPGPLFAPISNPGDVAIDAALHPSDGPWLYFVCVNYETGETIFSTTADEHAAAVDQWGQWLRENPQYDE